uniref:Uncharacterized protein n=1 Tax=Parascaris univalens TaxID=6257 RepID=A0A915B123_PARUN
MSDCISSTSVILSATVRNGTSQKSCNAVSDASVCSKPHSASVNVRSKSSIAAAKAFSASCSSFSLITSSRRA